MSDKYRTEYKAGAGDCLGPIVEYVVDQETEEYVGELSRWGWQEAGDKIKNGEWEPYKKAGDRQDDVTENDATENG